MQSNGIFYVFSYHIWESSRGKPFPDAVDGATFCRQRKIRRFYVIDTLTEQREATPWRRHGWWMFEAFSVCTVRNRPTDLLGRLFTMRVAQSDNAPLHKLPACWTADCRFLVCTPQQWSDCACACVRKFVWPAKRRRRNCHGRVQHDKVIYIRCTTNM